MKAIHCACMISQPPPTLFTPPPLCLYPAHPLRPLSRMSLTCGPGYFLDVDISSCTFAASSSPPLLLLWYSLVTSNVNDVRSKASNMTVEVRGGRREGGEVRGGREGRGGEGRGRDGGREKGNLNVNNTDTLFNSPCRSTVCSMTLL